MESGAAYDVFLNYRVKDSRGLVDPLYHRIIDAGLRVFREDDEFSGGEEISQSLLQPIQNSKIYIPIFSKNYASSSWCLRELAHMIRLRSESDGEKQILPIFYGVQPSDVELRTILYEEDLQELAKSFGSDDLGQWRNAMIEAAKTQGCVCYGSPESLGELSKWVVEDVLHMLKPRLRCLPEHLVGMGVRVSDVINLLDVGGDGVHFLGIQGMDGTGKTVLATAVFNELRSRFEGCSFVIDIREYSHCAGLVACQKKLLSDIIQSKPPSFNSIDEGRMFIRQRLANKKVLLLLDDIDHREQLEALAGDRDWFGCGSRIIITTRNSCVLDLAFPIPTYEMGILNEEEAFNLFSMLTFRRSFPPEDWYALSREAVSILGGLPLALAVTGLHLRGKGKAFWQAALKKLRVTPAHHIQDILKISYDALSCEQQQIFLDIACFFINKNVTDAIYMWKNCGFFPRQGIDELVAMSLIKIADDHTILMHNQLKDLGREIVRQENIDHPGRRSRVWDYGEALKLLGRPHKILKHVRAISLAGNPTSSIITNKEFARLPNLRFLELEGAILDGSFKNVLQQLRYLSWRFCPEEFTATNLHLISLVVLNLSEGHITDDWGGWSQIKVATRLKVLDLTGCQGITKMPDLSGFSSLERLLLCDCLELCTMDSSIVKLKCLTYLNLKGCINLQSLPKEIGALASLDYLCFEGCSKITELPSEMGYLKALRELNISDTGIQVLPDSLGKLKKLRVIHSEKDKSSLLSAEEPKRPRDELSEKLEGVNPSRKGTNYKEAVLGTTDWDSGSDLAKRPGKMSQMELQGSVNLEESMEKMKDEAGQRPEDMETSDRNYAIAAVRNIVGIDGRVKQITDLLEMEVNDEVRILGIFGTNGIGKTTLAKAVYDCISSCFDGCSFLAEVEETTQDPSGIQGLQTRLIRDILERDREDPSFNERIEDFLDIFCERKVLIVVDGVEEQSHLGEIVGDQLHWFGPGSRIIVTSENEEILGEYDLEKARTYTVSALDDGQAFELFCKHAFRIQSSRPDYDGLANRIVNATEKLPLAVEVVGSFLRGKSIQEWAKMEESMKAHATNSQKAMVGLEETLDICYDELDQQQKDIFLDIACFIPGVDFRIASYMWPNSYLQSSDCILMPLAKIGEHNELQMHRMLRRLGKRISKKKESQEPSSRRFCTQDMVLKEMKRETARPFGSVQYRQNKHIDGMQGVEALCFDFTAGDFQSMPDIRFLKLDNAEVSGNFAGAFASLRWLCWQRCPLEFDAFNFELRELVILDLSWSKVTEDWGGWREIKMEKLKVLNLTGCSDLLFTPDFSGYKDLEILILERCSHLVKLDPSIGHLKRLVSLNLKFCSQLNGLPVELGCVTALKELFIDGTSVREIPISIGNLNKLEILSGFKCFPLTHLPSSISFLTALSKLSLDGAKITELPSSLGELLKLTCLSLRDCRYMRELPDSLGKMGSSLKELDISGTSISKLPDSVRNLQSLRVLQMDSSFIRAFPREIGNLTKLKELHASWCRSLKGAVPRDIRRLHHLRSLTLGHSGISSLPSEISTLSSLHTLDLIQCNEIEVLPQLPSSLVYLRMSSKRMKAIPVLKDLKVVEELCLSDEDPKERQHPSEQLMPESDVQYPFCICFSRLWNPEWLQTQRIDKQCFLISSPKLRKLELSLSQIIKLKFEPTDIPQLKTLTLSGLSLKEVSELPKTLSVFELCHSAIEEIEGLEGLEALRRLEISNCNIQNLNGIGQLASLRSLILSDCDDLSLPDLSNLQSLKVLEIRRCKMIRQIEGIEKLTSLQKLNISECPALNSVQVQNALKDVMARSM